MGQEAVVRQKISKEVQAGRVVGPFASLPLPNLQVSPLGLVPKKVPGEFRLIHHLSFPEGSSVNDRIPAELCSVRYTSVDQAVSMVRSCGKGALMAKADIESAFRLLPVHPQDFCLLGFQFEGSYYVDRALPMGCSVSCAAFEAFSTFLEWLVISRSADPHVAHYLDDFLFAGKAGSENCPCLLLTFKGICAYLGVPLAHGKTEGPVSVLTFLGIELDSVAQCSRLPQAKVEVTRHLLHLAIGARKLTLRDLQRLIGHLNFACRVVAPGRAFLRRLCELTKGLRRPTHRARVTAQVRQDLVMWASFLDQFNGVSFWREDRLLEAELQVHSDAAGGLGFGVYFRGRWCASAWPDRWVELGLTRDITFLEFFPVVVALFLWGSELANSTVRFWCDNMAVVRIINKQTSRSTRVMRLVRVFVLRCLQLNLLFTARHVPGIDNAIPDSLSRFQVKRFRTLAPEASSDPDPMPPWLWSLGWQERVLLSGIPWPKAPGVATAGRW